MDGFFVDPDDLECAARQLRVIGSNVDANSLLRYSVSARSMGSEALANALVGLNQASMAALASLRNQSTATADRMDDALRTYREVDEAVAEVMTTSTDSIPASHMSPRSG